MTCGGIIHLKFNLAEFLSLLSHKPLSASCCKATPDRNPYAEKFTLSQQEIEPFASVHAREKLKGEATLRGAFLCPDFIESRIALVGERQVLRGFQLWLQREEMGLQRDRDETATEKPFLAEGIAPGLCHQGVSTVLFIAVRW